MSDERTDRQRRADEALDAAVREAQASRVAEDPEGMAAGLTLVSEWVVTGTAVSALDDSTDEATFLLLPDGGGHTSRSSVIGMLRCAQLHVESD